VKIPGGGGKTPVSVSLKGGPRKEQHGNSKPAERECRCYVFFKENSLTYCDSSIRERRKGLAALKESKCHPDGKKRKRRNDTSSSRKKRKIGGNWKLKN